MSCVICWQCGEVAPEISYCQWCGIFNGAAVGAPTVIEAEVRSPELVPEPPSPSAEEIDEDTRAWRQLKHEQEQEQDWHVVPGKATPVIVAADPRPRRYKPKATPFSILPTVEEQVDDENEVVGVEEDSAPGVAPDPPLPDLFQSTCDTLQFLCSTNAKQMTAWMKGMKGIVALAEATGSKQLLLASVLLVVAKAYASDVPKWFKPEEHLVMGTELPPGAQKLLAALLTALDMASPAYCILRTLQFLHDSVEVVGEAAALDLECLLLSAVRRAIYTTGPNILTVCSDSIGLRAIRKIDPPVEWMELANIVLEKHVQERALVERAMGKLELLDRLDISKHGQKQAHTIAALAIRRRFKAASCHQCTLLMFLHNSPIAQLETTCAKLERSIRIITSL